MEKPDDGLPKSVVNFTLRAEKEIQKILLTLEEDTLMRVDHVAIDTRNYANCSAEIFLKKL